MCMHTWYIHVHVTVHVYMVVCMIAFVHIQARLKRSNELVALKIIKIEPSMFMHVLNSYVMCRCTCMLIAVLLSSYVMCRCTCMFIAVLLNLIALTGVKSRS